MCFQPKESTAHPFTTNRRSMPFKPTGDILTTVDVLAQEVEVLGIFSDWSATTTFYANCIDP
jgi:hypothetical protein